MEKIGRPAPLKTSTGNFEGHLDFSCFASAAARQNDKSGTSKNKNSPLPGNAKFTRKRESEKIRGKSSVSQRV